MGVIRLKALGLGRTVIPSVVRRSLSWSLKTASLERGLGMKEDVWSGSVLGDVS